MGASSVRGDAEGLGIKIFEGDGVRVDNSIFIC